MAAAFYTFFCFNFFLIKPYYTLKVEDPRELIDLLVYLLVAVIASQLAAYAREQAEAANKESLGGGGNGTGGQAKSTGADGSAPAGPAPGAGSSSADSNGPPSGAEASTPPSSSFRGGVAAAV